MRVAVVAESFLPSVNGVTNSVCRVLDHLAERGHEAAVVAPGPGPETYAGFPVRLVRSFSPPFYRSLRIGTAAGRAVTAALREFGPDVVHLASPAVLGAAGAAAARRLGVPSVAVFQTDLAGFARRYGLRGADRLIWSWLRHVHRHTARTLAPSTATLDELARRGIPRLSLWRRGVDLDRFHPGHRSEPLRRELAPDGEVIVGYVGRLATEKRVHLLGGLAGLPGVRVVIVGDGPAAPRLRRALPEAVFCGMRTGAELSALVASFDVFVNTGKNETFCQAVQEALASGVPVVAAAAGGPLDLVRPGRNGLLFPADDASALRAAVAALAADPDTRAAMGAYARRSVLGRDWAAVCGELLGHYEDCFRSPESSARRMTRL
ncbi:phosphatidylinositol alpha 1,6-mannosyltransferase [Thermocatellispora tengchongensis]|uniref:Phosphatidylinositol alpha 1,6-mannosyltransferase n=1 Tax=Thermocatellispora tengchongensis TaxID=1073253 RepID=A0A840PJY8_9ACTN|nr:glycosyltransferase family 1 protein [Thermocatellispora tengchongensis]MBB5139226.1 phosphatidylinositol alpha 1,6-mannosyltransferase [Thermocatellispora tengchongensis]